MDWGDGTALQTLASGFANPTTHVYTKDGFYKVTARGNGVGVTQTVRVGSPAVPAWETAKVRERREAAADEIAGLAGTTGLLG